MKALESEWPNQKQEDSISYKKFKKYNNMRFQLVGTLLGTCCKCQLLSLNVSESRAYKTKYRTVTIEE